MQKWYWLFGCMILVSALNAQQNRHHVSRVWVADLGNGTYQNPIIHADYSDPTVTSVRNNYYMIASSFNSYPGLPMLLSNDLYQPLPLLEIP